VAGSWIKDRKIHQGEIITIPFISLYSFIIIDKVATAVKNKFLLIDFNSFEMM